MPSTLTTDPDALRGRRGYPLTPERKQLIRKCLDDGWSWMEIQKTHQVSHATLARHFPGTQMDLTEAARLGALTRNANRKMREMEN